MASLTGKWCIIIFTSYILIYLFIDCYIFVLLCTLWCITITVHCGVLGAILCTGAPLCAVVCTLCALRCAVLAICNSVFLVFNALLRALLCAKYWCTDIVTVLCAKVIQLLYYCVLGVLLCTLWCTPDSVCLTLHQIIIYLVYFCALWSARRGVVCMLGTPLLNSPDSKCVLFWLFKCATVRSAVF